MSPAERGGGRSQGQLAAQGARLAACEAELLTSEARGAELAEARLGFGALFLCTAAHPLNTRLTKRFGASLSETTMRPKPRCGRPSC
jgi:hypothetical protein